MKYIWTSGRLCDFKGCNRPDLLPNEVNGWFWTAELQKLAPTTNRQQNDWSEGGGIGKPQPDNRVCYYWLGANKFVQTPHSIASTATEGKPALTWRFPHREHTMAYRKKAWHYETKSVIRDDVTCQFRDQLSNVCHKPDLTHQSADITQWKRKRLWIFMGLRNIRRRAYPHACHIRFLQTGVSSQAVGTTKAHLYSVCVGARCLRDFPRVHIGYIRAYVPPLVRTTATSLLGHR